MGKSLTQEKKINYINEWEKCSFQEKEILAKKYGYAHAKSMRGAIIKYKRELNIGVIKSPLPKEEKLNRINEWGKCCSYEEKQKFADKYKYKNVESAANAITSYKSKLRKTPLKLCKIGNNNDERNIFVKKWEGLSITERKKLAVKLCIPYQKILTLVSSQRKRTGSLICPNIRRTDEEKIEMINKYNSMNKDERIEYASSFGLSLPNLARKISYYRYSLNINEYRSNIVSNEKKLEMIREWDNLPMELRNSFVKKYKYKNINSARSSINDFRKQLNL